MSNALKIAFIIALIAAACTAAYGWVHNLFTLVMHTPEMGTEFVLRLVGVFFGPLGAFMGLFV